MFISFQPTYFYNYYGPHHLPSPNFQSDVTIFDLQIPGGQSSFIESSPLVNPLTTTYGQHVTGGFVPSTAFRKKT
ncbi:hypothetical protein ACFYKX_05705 [Cytobacillus sp. FJAT-54145]|uniref:Uncharacterized protein n=1 Tax=Cytobacillus spartinae TaxID=3299023 RepID=A0ABW6KBF2_9BACI